MIRVNKKFDPGQCLNPILLPCKPVLDNIENPLILRCAGITAAIKRLSQKDPISNLYLWLQSRHFYSMYRSLPGFTIPLD